MEEINFLFSFLIIYQKITMKYLKQIKKKRFLLQEEA
jgi:hypothetical protein